MNTAGTTSASVLSYYITHPYVSKQIITPTLYHLIGKLKALNTCV